MGKDSYVFVTFMLLIAFIANKLTAIISSAIYVVGAVVLATLVFRWLKNQASGTLVKSPKTVTMNANFIPPDYDMLEQYILMALKLGGDTHKALLGRFLGKINANDGTAIFPSYLHNGVAKKMLWEYRKKFGNLEFEIGRRNTLSVQEVLAPLQDTERNDFHQFCLELSM